MDSSNKNTEHRDSLEVKEVIEKYYFTNDETGEIIVPNRRVSSSSSSSNVEIVDEYTLDVLSPYEQTENLAYDEDNPAESKAIKDAIVDLKSVINKSAATEESGAGLEEDHYSFMGDECSSPSETSAYSFHSTKTENTDKTTKTCETIYRLAQKIRPFQAESPLAHFNADKFLQEVIKSESGYFSGNSGSLCSILERHNYIRGDSFADTFGHDYTIFTQASRKPQLRRQHHFLQLIQSFFSIFLNCQSQILDSAASVCTLVFCDLTHNKALQNPSVVSKKD